MRNDERNRLAQTVLAGLDFGVISERELDAIKAKLVDASNVPAMRRILDKWVRETGQRVQVTAASN